jgi:hypothetical protein
VVTVVRRTADDSCVTAPQTTEDVVPTEEIDAAARALVQRLYDEAMQLIADLAENWEPTAAAEPAEPISVLRISQLPAPPPRPPARTAEVLATAVTDQIAVQQAAHEQTRLPAAA